MLKKLLKGMLHEGDEIGHCGVLVCRCHVCGGVLYFTLDPPVHVSISGRGCDCEEAKVLTQEDEGDGED